MSEKIHNRQSFSAASSERRNESGMPSLHKLPSTFKTNHNFNSKTERFFTPKNFAHDAEVKVLQKNNRMMSNPILKSDLKRNLDSIRKSNRGEMRMNKNFLITSRAFNNIPTDFNYTIEKIKGSFNNDDFINLTKQREERVKRGGASN